MSDANKMWGGHFSSAPSEIMEEINASIGYDRNLYKQDIAGSIVHCTMLARQQIITDDEAGKIISGLQQIEGEIEAGEFTFSRALEDIHMNIEARLREIIGDVAGKLHTARSRNDQVALDFRMWVRDNIDMLIILCNDLQQQFGKKAKQYASVIMPGYTHLQTAQPVTFGHHLMAYANMIERDITRLYDCRERLNESPLGAAALAGTSFPIDRDFTASELGFDRPMNNSLDAVSDRDYALEYLGAISILATHLSRLAEEIVLWTSYGFKFITLSDAFTTGSSIMPQKRNPDAAELVRAKTGRINGAFITLSTVMKGLPLAYSKDMQEDKEQVFDAAKSIELAVRATIGMVEDMTPNADNMLEHAQSGYSTATDLADWLVRVLGVPFRDAHHITGRIVVLAEGKNCRLDELSIADIQSVDARITQDIFDVLSVESSVNSRTSFGGTAPSNVVKMATEILP